MSGVNNNENKFMVMSIMTGFGFIAFILSTLMDFYKIKAGLE